MVDPWTNYIQLITGLSNATRARARSAARSALAQVGLDEVADDASERITKLTEEIQAASKANREMLENLISTEVERAAGHLGFARKDDLEAVRAEVAVLRTMIQLQTPNSAATTTSAETTASPTRKSSAKQAPAKKTTAKKVAGAAAKKAAASKTSDAKTATAKTPSAKIPAAKKAPAKKSPAPKSPAQEPLATSTSTDPEPTA